MPKPSTLNRNVWKDFERGSTLSERARRSNLIVSQIYEHALCANVEKLKEEALEKIILDFVHIE